MKNLSPLVFPLVFALGLCYGEETTLRTCRIVFPERPAKSPKSAHLFDGKKSSFVRLPSLNFSRVIELPAGKIRLALTDEQVDSVSKIPDGAPGLEIAEGVEDLHLILSSDPANAVLPVKMELVDVSKDQIRDGGSFWINRTNHAIRSKLGNVTIKLESNENAVCSKPAEESSYYRAEFSFLPKGATEWRIITEQNWWHDQKSRHLGLIMASEAGLPRVLLFRDFRPPGGGN